MLIDRYSRIVNYLRVSVTDRCNYACQYCRSEEDLDDLHNTDVLSLDELFTIIQKLVDLGINKVRITGGEPLVRKGILTFVEKLAALEGIKDLAMTTNGSLLYKYAQPLKTAGLHRINISLDTLDPNKFYTITRGGNLEIVLKGIMAAKKVGLSPVKINTVIIPSFNEDELTDIGLFCEEHGFEIRYIQEMKLNEGIRGLNINTEGGICEKCNRLRLTSDGKIRPCLFSDIEIDLKKLDLKEAINITLQTKPEYGIINTSLPMVKIGG